MDVDNAQSRFSLAAGDPGFCPFRKLFLVFPQVMANGYGASGSTRMDLSIIIVNWNTEKLLRDCLSSVVANRQASAHEGLDLEIFVVDNGSSDGSPQMVEQEFPGVILIKNQDNRGFAAANNQAIEHATGKYVLLLNSDTLVHGDVLANAVAYMERHENVAVLGCRVLNEDGSVQPSCGTFPGLLNLVVLSSGLWKLPSPAFLARSQLRPLEGPGAEDVDYVSGCFMCLRRSALDDVGVLDERFFFFGEEVDWCRRFREKGYLVRAAPVGDITHFGSASARRLNHKRDLMLTSGIVLLHRKHRGIVAAALAWGILLGFNISRVAFWSLRQIVAPCPATRARRDHFRAVVKNFHRAWPSMEAGSLAVR
jgi:GT2 family glycosyltransferase